MLTLPRAAITGLLLVGAIGLGVACSDDPTTTPTTKPKPVCPDTIQKGAGAKCNVEGYSCGVGFYCTGGFAQQATCSCLKGSDGALTYECKTSLGDVIPAGTTDVAPFCKNTSPTAEACPASVTVADGTTCKTSGKLCYYTGKTCPENVVPLYDVCMCRTGVTDAALGWLCETKTCAK